MIQITNILKLSAQGKFNDIYIPYFKKKRGLQILAFNFLLLTLDTELFLRSAAFVKQCYSIGKKNHANRSQILSTCCCIVYRLKFDSEI